jgi:hypothetical protein
MGRDDPHYKDMEPIEVTVRFDEQGCLTPLNFTWKGSVHQVEATGRRWVDTNGQHILAMVAQGRIYELIYKSSEGRWFIGKAAAEQNFI